MDTQNVSSSINVTNNAALLVIAKGMGNVSADIETPTCKISMNGVLRIPSPAVNVLSVSKMCQKGYSVTFMKELWLDQQTKYLVVIGQETGGLYCTS